MPGESVSEGPGFFGKLPGQGDFVTRALPADFVRRWDDWLQASLAASRRQLGEAWLEFYLTSPVWCFALSPGICGRAAIAGVLIPSVDRVGRYFPFTLACPVPDACRPLGLWRTAAAWYAAAEGLALSALHEDASPAMLLEGALELGVPAVADDRATGRYTAGVRFAADEAAAPGDRLVRHLADLAPLPSLWWSKGSQQLAPSVLISAALPRPEGFAALLDGQWSARGWGEAA
jgi:type VI secretion system protein ImpM